MVHLVKQHTILKAVIILLAGLWIYSPVFNGGWIWDDGQEVTNNAMLWNTSGLRQIWMGEQGADYLPVKTTFQRLYFQVVGKDAAKWHWLNIALHILNAFLLWRLFSVIGLAQAWLGAFLFAIHPLAVESVAWISELKNTLSLAFLLLSALAYLEFVARERRSLFLLAIVLYVCALLSKPSVVMFPFIILLYAWWKEKRVAWRDLLRSLPFFLASVAVGLVTIHFQSSRAIGDEVIPVGGITSRIAIAGLAVLFYFSKCIVPLGLLPTYPRWEVDPPSIVQFLAWPFIFGVLYFLWKKRETWGAAVLLGVGFFLINLLPVLGFIPMSYMRITWTADHFVYLPLIGIVGLVALGTGEVFDLFPSLRKSVLIVGGGVVVLLIITSHSYAKVFVNERTVWTYTLRNNPGAWNAHASLLRLFASEGDYESALIHSQEAVRLHPDEGTYNNHAVVLQFTGHYAEALMYAEKAVQLNPKHRGTLGFILMSQKRYAEAEKVYVQLLQQSPRNAEFLARYGSVLIGLGRFDEGVDYLRKAVAVDPRHNYARTRLKRALEEKPEKDKAVSESFREGGPE